LFALLVSVVDAADDAPPAEKPAAGQTPPAAEAAADTPADAPVEPDRYAVPDGSVEELLAFIEKLQTFRPTNVQDYVQHRDKSPAALEAAARAIQEKVSDRSSEAYRKADFVLLKLKADGISRLEPEQQGVLLQEILDALKDRQLGRDELGIAISVTRSLEYSASQERAIEAYQAFGKLFAASDDAEFARYGEMLLGSARRMQLPGKALELSGTRMNGEAFEIAQLKDKVVLVDFWATWCGPCRAEFPNIQENYQKYHAAGFEVVGVSLDQNRQALEAYLKEKQVPWITLHEADQDGRHPATTRYGISGIPTMFLVGRDGNVISTRARGGELNRLLAEQFPDVAAQDTPADNAGPTSAEQPPAKPSAGGTE
jgi:thiol-disulfide isomerase/thioredoxin